MGEDREQTIKRQFLAEAQEYLNTIESELLGLSNAPLQPQSLKAVLRAAHSIKGSAAMMEFMTLSSFAHRLEDCFKVLNSGQLESIPPEVEMLLLSSIDLLREIITFALREEEIEQSWLEANVEPIFEQLNEHLGKPQPEADFSIIATDGDREIKVLLFQTEVEEYLQRLETALPESSPPALRGELSSIAQELAGLSQMLQIDSLVSLCESIVQELETNPEEIVHLANRALYEWRKAQTKVIAGEENTIPRKLELEEQQINVTDNEDATSPATTSMLLTLDETEILPIAAEQIPLSPEVTLDWIASLENITKEEEEPSPISNIQQKSPPALTAEKKSATDNEIIDNSIRVSIRHLDSLNELFGEYTVERNSMNLRLKRMRRFCNLLQQKIQLLNQYKTLQTQEVRNLYNSLKVTPVSVGIDTSKNSQERDYPWTNNQELRDINTQSYNLSLSQEAFAIIDQIAKITDDLNYNLEEAEFTANAFTRNSEMMQTRLNQIRMRPLAELVAPFPRALRNLELQYGKKAQLKIRGSSTLIDRTIIESLKSPLIQLVRNAFAHGIEDPITRKAKGKPEQGTITINASYRGDRIVISVSDDGQGIDLEKIRTKAIAMGLIAAAPRIRKSDLLQLIFKPGFSTADELTDLAGRGMGMDVVKTNLEEIGGTIDVQSIAEVGTTLTIAVPFKLSVLRVLLVESNNMLLAFPSNVVEEMLIVEPEKIFTKGGQEFFNLEDSIVPLLRLDRCLHIPAAAAKFAPDEIPSINQPTVLIVSQGNELFGIQTDRYWREEEVTVRQVEGNLALPEGFCSCTLLGDGQVVPLVDVLALLKSINNPSTSVSPQLEPDFAPTQPTTTIDISPQLNHLPSLVSSEVPNSDVPEGLASLSPPRITYDPNNNTVMLIDDSVNSRHFLALTLEKYGYQSEQAGDGREALEKLAAGVSVFAIICDLEMPRLDGFGFLSQVKSNPQYQHLPVIMLTARSGEKHRQAAMNLGATAYMNKPFNKEELWRVLAQLKSS